ncbi:MULTISPECIES: DUF5682 family protein [Rhodococcus]|uniref:DUF5682 family protein n=1 Tax=Rhodococcus TaxID=1827 RepID=UPI000815791C|nr:MULTISPECIES: DUF5682 family protein [Rhodococcus]MBX9149794.1 hypothetical protein [Rhodococcus qingshengii]MCJ0948026.1 DUF5682 family protein [Rhodococcus sp. ARC_M8]MCZ9630904.1 DUF5682 family protein [Rhodococcus sp. BH5]ULD43225.1 DUF5682 family protein [Rhodococcus qingshengii]SCC32391.1 hypothetical protein GA0061093_106232 [Rhodococcus qingshengii]
MTIVIPDLRVRVFGIRHHGPGSARSVRQGLEEFSPDVVLIEGPSDADPLVMLAASESMEPPIALLAYATGEPSKAAFWPFAVFSPEWQALQWAAKNGVQARFCDLPAFNVLADQGIRTVREGDPLSELAAAAGFDDTERWWDSVIESSSGADSFDAITEAMEALRETVPIDEETAHREAYMRQVLRKTLKDGAERVAVVCGAWHAPALVGALGPAAPDARILKGMSKVKTSLTWVPWTHSRLASASGYGAGITSPGWYHHLFTANDKTITRWLTKVARVLRDEDLPISSAHVIEAVRLADTLAALRSRPLAGLSEVTEATRSVMCDGNDVLLDLITRRLVVGEALGAVPEETPTVPLEADLRARSKTLRLKQQAGAKNLDLDLRRDIDVERSQFLHRLGILEIDWGTPADSEVRSTGTFRETWALQWKPEFSVSVIEASLWGTTVAAAATSRVVSKINEPDISLASLIGLLENSLLANLPAALSAVLESVKTVAALDHDVSHLMAALPTLTRTLRYGDVRGTDVSALVDVADSLLIRICTGLAVAVTGLDDPSAEEFREHLDKVHSAVMVRDDRDASARWLQAMAGVIDRDDVNGLLVGRMVRLLRDSGSITETAAAQRLSRALSVGSTPTAKAGWVDGFLGGGGLVLVHDRALLTLIDTWVRQLREQDFIDTLPLLRRTFGAFEAGERRAIGQAVRGGRRVETTVETDARRGRAAMAVVADILGVGA